MRRKKKGADELNATRMLKKNFDMSDLSDSTGLSLNDMLSASKGVDLSVFLKVSMMRHLSNVPNYSDNDSGSWHKALLAISNVYERSLSREQYVSDDVTLEQLGLSVQDAKDLLEKIGGR